MQCSHHRCQEGINKHRHLQVQMPASTSPRGTSWVGVLSRSCIVSDTPILTAQPMDF